MEEKSKKVVLIEEWSLYGGGLYRQVLLYLPSTGNLSTKNLTILGQNRSDVKDLINYLKA